MKRLLLFIPGLIISYLIFFFLAFNGGLLSKLFFGLVMGISYHVFLSQFTAKVKNPDLTKTVGQLLLAACVALTIGTYEAFSKYTFGTFEEQKTELTATGKITIGKVDNIEYYKSSIVKQKGIPEYWEIKYSFIDLHDDSYDGLYISKKLPWFRIADSLQIRYAPANPSINEPILN